MRFQPPMLFKVMGVMVFLFVFSFAIAAEAFASGTKLFVQNCSMCHGTDGKGYPTLKTPNFTRPKVQASLTDKKIIETIKNGKKGTAMPAFADKLSEEEIHSLLVYLRSLKR